MRFWQCLAMLDMRELPRLARHAEELGFEGISLGEHLVTFASQYDRYDYSANALILWYPETDWPDPWVQIGALSQVTTRLRFLTTVYVLPLRDPFNAAKAIATAANLASGRVVLGVGVGWQATEFEIVGQDFKTRGRRTDEMLEVMQKLWTGEIVAHEGRDYRFPPLQMSPGVAGGVPVWVGGTSASALARAARHDGWCGALHSRDELAGLIRGLGAARAERGLSLAGFEIATSLADDDEATIESARELGVTVVARSAFLDENRMASKMTLDEKLRDMDRFAKRWL